MGRVQARCSSENLINGTELEARKELRFILARMAAVDQNSSPKPMSAVFERPSSCRPSEVAAASAVICRSIATNATPTRDCSVRNRWARN
jgi:hypothetical protein